jgi:FixJ family two-component response regulator
MHSGGAERRNGSFSSPNSPGDAEWERISDDERAPLALTDLINPTSRNIAEGKSSKETAGNLGISVKTVETRRSNFCANCICRVVEHVYRFGAR